MDDCRSNHPQCFGDDPTPLPTRVAAVGQEDEEPSLYETQENETGKYTALSHCWGPPGRRPPTTTGANISMRKRSIPMGELSQTFSEAAQLTRIPYLWIDSLCIIQDDGGDW